MRTFLVEEELKHVETVEYTAGFRKFMEKNESEFSAVREKEDTISANIYLFI